MSEDVELCLEIQVDPESKKILSSPEKCRSTLLDVTVIKPKELEAFGTHQTNTYRAEEVRKLISSLEKQRRRKQKVLDKLQYDDTIVKVCKHESYNFRKKRKPFSKHKDRISSSSPVDNLERKDFIGITESVQPLFCEIRRSLKNVETRITNMQDLGLEISQSTVDVTASDRFVYPKVKKHVIDKTSRLRHPSCYRVETTPRDLKSILVCPKKNTFDKGDKIEGQCLCQNCGTVGLLMECQQHPLLRELEEAQPPPYYYPTRQETKNKKTNFNISNSENSKLKCEDFAYINHLTNRVKLLEERLSAQEERIVPKDYFKKVISKMTTNLATKARRSGSDISIKQNSKYKKKETNDKSINTIRHNRKFMEFYGEEKMKKLPPRKSDKSTTTDAFFQTGPIWRWGEDILKPGIDLKKRIVMLFNELLGKFATTDRVQNQPSAKRDSFSPESFKNFMEHMNTKIFNAQIDTRTNYLDKSEKQSYGNLSKVIIEERGKERSNKVKNVSKDIDVSYVNPKLCLWRNESPSFLNVFSNQTETGKEEFLKIASKAKRYQKEILWKNIWDQASANGQSKSDKITIKIPRQKYKGKDCSEMLETELTIKEVEDILKCC